MALVTGTAASRTASGASWVAGLPRTFTEMEYSGQPEPERCGCTVNRSCCGSASTGVAGHWRPSSTGGVTPYGSGWCARHTFGAMFTDQATFDGLTVPSAGRAGWFIDRAVAGRRDRPVPGHRVVSGRVRRLI